MDFTQTQSRTLVGGHAGFAVPLVVAVTGHRDLVPGEEPEIRARVRAFLQELLTEFPDRGVTVMSALAEGADQLVAEEALELGIPLVAPLPMPRQLYVQDFESVRVRERFDYLLSRAAESFELPITPGNTPATIASHGKNRSRQYAQLGVFLSAHCHILLALWDGKLTDDLGGTGQVVRFHHDDVMPGYTPRSAGSGMILTDDESDLVYHIVCSRDRDGGEPTEELQALDWWWFMQEEPSRSKLMPTRHRRVFATTSEFSRDAVEHADRIRDEAYSLLSSEPSKLLPSGLRDIDHVFRAADWLAIHFQKRMMTSLRVTHLLAMLMGMTYIGYSDVEPLKIYLYSFLLLFVVATAIHVYGKRRAWHRKYLDYRTLAEGLRVQLYWTAAGVNRESVSKFAHDNFLQTQDPDLGWIRNVMRVAGTECDAASYDESPGLDFALGEWLGDEHSGQMGYYGRKIRERLKRTGHTERFARLVFWFGVIAIALFTVATGDVADRLRDPIIILMGVMLLAVGVGQSYSFNVADTELIKRYRFMHRIFSNARQRIDEAKSDDERRRVLRVLGEAALDENAQWILMHRDRAVDQGEIFMMSG